MPLEFQALPDSTSVAAHGAEYILEQANAAIAERDRFSFAVSGGETPWAMFALLAGKLSWEKVTVYQVDERIAPDDDPDRNLTHLKESFSAGSVAAIQAMPVGADDLEAAAAEYDASLPERLDLVHLGLGPDGHTASLVPGDPVLEVSDRGVALTGEYQGRRRMTLTYPTLNRARRILWVVTGASKVDALRRLRAADHSIPGGRVNQESALVLADAAAVGDTEEGT
jgi:6-phosphogluconolactonase